MTIMKISPPVGVVRGLEVDMPYGLQPEALDQNPKFADLVASMIAIYSLTIEALNNRQRLQDRRRSVAITQFSDHWRLILDEMHRGRYNYEISNPEADMLERIYLTCWRSMGGDAWLDPSSSSMTKGRKSIAEIRKRVAAQDEYELLKKFTASQIGSSGNVQSTVTMGKW